ncbi:vgr related protein [Sphingomonas crusticola]|uniref:vgr related protein n=1 Tax=Sphingomonas crusticola TaxID=1697973 RepID=UPI000E237462|nr:vgr related protein [Sphingomonas crusticola]
MACSIFGDALDVDAVRLHAAKWWPFQPRNAVMAPDGDVWFHPAGGLWREDFAGAHPRLQALLIHELTHVWQRQHGLNLVLRRHPFCRYDYRIVPGRPLSRYGIEQQAMIVEHAFVARKAGQPNPALESLLRAAGLLASAPVRNPASLRGA